jgi:hypothetical protein
LTDWLAEFARHRTCTRAPGERTRHTLQIRLQVPPRPPGDLALRFRFESWRLTGASRLRTRTAFRGEGPHYDGATTTVVVPEEKRRRAFVALSLRTTKTRPRPRRSLIPSRACRWTPMRPDQLVRRRAVPNQRTDVRRTVGAWNASVYSSRKAPPRVTANSVTPVPLSRCYVRTTRPTVERIPTGSVAQKPAERARACSANTRPRLRRSRIQFHGLTLLEATRPAAIVTAGQPQTLEPPQTRSSGRTRL